MLTLSEKEKLITDLIKEDNAVTIKDYLETIKEIEAITQLTDNQTITIKTP